MNSLDSKYKILKLALLFEGLLALVFVVFQINLGNSLVPQLPTPNEIIFALLLSQLLFIFNSVLVRVGFKNDWKLFKDFIHNMIFPIASKIDFNSALLISLAAGIGEELFFRGFLQEKFGIIFASVVFGLVHFIFEIKKYFPIVILYILIGFIFGITYEFFGSLWVPVIFHCFYDFTALLYFKNQIQKGNVF